MSYGYYVQILKRLIQYFTWHFAIVQHNMFYLCFFIYFMALCFDTIDRKVFTAIKKVLL